MQAHSYMAEAVLATTRTEARPILGCRASSGFDVPILAGEDVTSEQLVRRRALLQSRVLSKLDEPIRESPILDASLPDLIRSVKAQGLEGIVAKRLDSPYEPGLRSGMWQKMRVNVCPAKAGVFSGSQPHPNKSQSSVAWIAGRKETEPRKSIDKAILGMASESLGRNESERTGDPETLYLRGRAPADRAKAAWNVAD